MLKKPGSASRILWFFYKTRRKIHILRKRGTFIHKTPKNERLIIASASHMKRSRKFRRKLRHIFLYFRTGTLKRYNKKVDFDIKRSREFPKGYQLLSGKPVISDIIVPSLSRPSFWKRIRRSIRLATYVILKARKSAPSKGISSRKKKSKIYRKFRYLYHTGKLCQFKFRPLFVFLNRNYSFLGKGKYLIVLLNSTFIFLLAYLLIFLVKEIAIIIAARSFNISAVMMYYDVEFLIRSRDWTADAVQVVFSTGPLIAFILTLITIITFALISHEIWTIRLFIMWIFLHALTQSLGEMICGALLNQGFGWVLAYLYINDTTKMLLVIGIIIVMVTCGMFFSRFMLFTGNIYFNFINKANRSPFIISQILLPFLIGTGIITIIKQPLLNSFEPVVESSMMLILLPALLNARFSDDLFFDEEPRKIRIKWVWILISILILIFFRIYFWKGVRI
jgi:hypothetical protein